ncbi:MULTISPECIES: PIN domain-containing protein [Bacteroidaceae]|uniref:DUF4935 domain-containing protein n=7 Tax=Bacteroidaceae TaxID=815 RepID=A0A6I0ZNE5_PHOVU|nr:MULTISPECIES: PIN domain-containing protein [Bacteroidaceae]KAB6445535.1 DUF4935 domain-containing protein [Phocaeicola vulgatus]KAA5311487.1 DUF4935 domain-containing protein [Phocaeicola dorei]KAB3913295.1 DUF4935 domain-containing protein [Bacteroides uniformis]KAB3926188.1 DUF4935 domain-containing protein [Bacteroides uniformis]KAB3926262.1 DUF4935 domain-containing protein [Bacteroides uniformis]
MNHIIIDTNVIHLDFKLNKARIVTLCNTSTILGHEIFIPEVVIDEIVKQYDEKAEEYINSFNKALKKLSDLSTSPITQTPIDAKGFISNYRNELNNRIKQLGIGIIPYPNTGHKIMVERELGKKKPFKDSTKGYRDALIWDSVMEHTQKYSSNCGIIFLTANSKDFADKDKKDLHTDLIADCISNGIPTTSIRLVTDIQNFIDNEIILRSTELKEKFNQLQQDGGLGDIDFIQLIQDYISKDMLDNLISSNDFDSYPGYAPGLYENPEITSIEKVSCSFNTIREISSDTILIQSEVSVLVDLDCFIFRADLPLIDDSKFPTIIDYEWNDHYVLASDSATFKFQFNILTDTNFKNVKSIEDNLQQVKYSTGYTFN